MKLPLALAAAMICATVAAAEPPKPLVKGLMMPTAVAVGPGGKVFVAVNSNGNKNGTEGAILRIDDGKAVPFVSGLLAPRGLVAFQRWLFVVESRGVLRIDGNGKVEVFVDASSFPSPPAQLRQMAVDAESGTLFVIDDGGREKTHPAIYRIAPNRKVSTVLDAKRLPPGAMLEGIVTDGASHLVFGDTKTAKLYRCKLADGSTEIIAEDLLGPTGLTWDRHGRLLVACTNFTVYAIPRPGTRPIPLAEGFKFVFGICLDASGRNLLVPDFEAGTITAVPISIPGHEVDETPLPLHTEVAFPNLEWTGWKGETDSGKINTLRPIVLTHANDNSNRVFVATEHGVIHHFPNDQKATKTTIFLDIQDRVSYRDDQNEEGFLGLTFHPKFKDNGEFFVFYTSKKEKATNILSRFRVKKDDPSHGDPDSEEVLMRFKKPFWNHDGGTILFGPDGYLYVTHGDGGAANDPYDNGQNLNSLLGKIHRIDVNQKSKSFNYAIPPDNPFVGNPNAKPEIWAYGLRNVWRMSFDRKTGKLWAGDVGQNLFEEIDIIEKGGNYGWNRREGLHPFGPKGTGVRKEFIEPIWEYHHDVGKSIIGGNVYRGPRLPELDGMYIYGDYVSAKIWALKYDETKARVVANRPIKDRSLPMFSFGEDSQGEVYMLTPTNNGKGIYWFTK
jgi:glucose/arabinose dehydrogenase